MNRREFSAMMTAGIGLALIGGRMAWAQTADTPADAPATPTDAALPVVPDMSLGNPDANVVLTEYASFTCPHCADWHETVYPLVKKNYIDTGKIKFVYREVFFDRYGLWAAMLARCGGDLRYFGISDILYKTQRDWAGSDDPTVVVDNLKQIGRTAGLDDKGVDACMQDAGMAQALVAKFEATSKADGINSTPSFILDGKKYSNIPYDQLAKALDAELAK